MNRTTVITLIAFSLCALFFISTADAKTEVTGRYVGSQVAYGARDGVSPQEIYPIAVDSSGHMIVALSGDQTITGDLSIDGDISATGDIWANGRNLADSTAPIDAGTLDGQMIRWDQTEQTYKTASGLIWNNSTQILDIAGRVDVVGDITATNDLSIDKSLTVDTTTLVVDAQNNKVGIGTSTPSQLLVVETGADATAGFLGVRLGGENRYIKMGNNASDVSQILFDDNDALSFGQETLFSGDGSSTTELLRIEREGGTNRTLLGVGEDNPIYEVDVVGDIHATENLFIDSKIGIGTTAPTAKLHVSGDVLTSGVLTASGTLSPSGVCNYAVIDANGQLGKSVETYPAAGGGAEADTLDTVTGRGNTTSNAIIVGDLTVTGNSDNQQFLCNGSDVFHKWSDGTLELSSTETNTVVRIGKNDALGSGTATLILQDDSGAYSTELVQTDGTLSIQPKSSASHVVFNPDKTASDYCFKTPNADNMLFIEGSADAVGINNATPTAALDIVGDVRISSDITVTGLPSGATQPAGVGAGQLWIDTDDQTLKVGV